MNLSHSVNPATFTTPSHAALTPLRKADVDNHNADGGAWTIIHDRVYDLRTFQTFAPCGSATLADCPGKSCDVILLATTTCL